MPSGCTVGGNASCFDATAAAAVRAADAVVVVVGLDGSQEAEGNDRKNLSFPGTQSDLLSAVASAAAESKIPVIVLVMSGGAIDLTAVKADERVGAVAWVGYPGQSGGDAIADALFGITNQWGKLPATWYDDGFCAVAALDDYAMRCV